MSISDVDIKKLWGKAAGRCCFDNCGANCIVVSEDLSMALGEMAHIIARRPSGPRGCESRDDDNSYDNLILLCPTHHTIVDKAPEVYTEECLRAMKKRAEDKVFQALNSSQRFSTLDETCDKIAKLLVENKTIWESCGPDSISARRDPFSSNMAEYWKVKKLCIIVPNNKKIISIINANRDLFDLDFYLLASKFIGHASDFEQNCYERIDCAKRFPIEFEREVFNHARQWME